MHVKCKRKDIKDRLWEKIRKQAGDSEETEMGEQKI